MHAGRRQGMLEDPGLDAAVARYVAELGSADVPATATRLEQTVRASNDPSIAAAFDRCGAADFARAARRHQEKRAVFDAAVERYATEMRDRPAPALFAEVLHAYRREAKGATPEKMQRLAETHRMIEAAVDAFGIDAFADAVRAKRSAAEEAAHKEAAEPKPKDKPKSARAEAEADKEKRRVEGERDFALYKELRRRSPTAARAMLERAAAAGQREACFELGRILLETSGETEERRRGLGLLYRAARFQGEGLPDARRYLAHLYTAGVPGAVSRNLRIASAWSKKAAVTGERDPEYARDPVATLKKRSAAGDELATYELACRMLEGDHVPVDRAGAFALLGQLAERRRGIFRWAKEKMAEVEAEEAVPFRRSLPPLPITSAYEALLQPMVLGRPPSPESALQRLLAADPIFDALAGALADHGKETGAGVVDFLALFLDASRPIDERIRRFEARRPEIEAALEKLGPKPCYGALFRLLAERYSLWASGAKSPLERSIADWLSPYVSRSAARSSPNAALTVPKDVRDSLEALGRRLDAAVEPGTSVHDWVGRAVAVAEQGFDVADARRAGEELARSADGALDVLAGRLEGGGRATEAALVDFLSIFFDPTLAPEARVAKLRDRRGEMSRALEAVLGFGAGESPVSFEALFGEIGGALGGSGATGASALLGALRERVGRVRGAESWGALFGELAAIGRSLDAISSKRLPAAERAAEMLDAVERAFGEVGRLDPRDITTYAKIVGAAGAALAVQALPMLESVDLRAFLGVREDPRPLLVALAARHRLLPDAVASDLGPARAQSVLEFLSLFCDPGLTREAREQIFDRSVRDAARLFDFAELPHASWLEILDGLGERVARLLSDGTGAGPQLSDFVRGRLRNLGRDLDAAMRTGSGDAMGNMAERSITGFLCRHREEIVGGSILEAGSGLAGDARAVLDAASRAVSISYDDLLDNVLPGLGLAGGRPILASLDRQVSFVPQALRARLGERGTERLLEMLSLFVDPFLERGERERILDEAIRSGGALLADAASSYPSFSAMLDAFRGSLERAAESKGIAIRPDARAWFEARTRELGARLDRLAGPEGVSNFLIQHRAEILDLSVLRPARSRAAWGAIVSDASAITKDVAAACRLSKDDVVALIPEGIEIAKSLGDANTAALVDLLNLFFDPDITLEEKRRKVADVSSRLGDLARSLLVAIDDKKRPTFFADLCARIGRNLDEAKKRSAEKEKHPPPEPHFERQAAEVGKAFDQMITALKDPANERRLESHLDVIRFFFAVEGEALLNMNIHDPQGTREALDTIARDMSQLADVAVNFARGLSALPKLDNHQVSQEVVAQEIRASIENMGPFFTKMAQTLVEFFDVSNTGDDSAGALVGAIKQLQDATRPIPFSEVEKVVEQSLHKPLDQAFVRFEKKPFASGSIAQCHLAEIEVHGRLRTVVVKILKPEAVESLRHNFELIRFVLKVMGAMANEVVNANLFKDGTMAKELEEARKKIGADSRALDDLDLRDIAALLDMFAVNVSRSFVAEGDLIQEAKNMKRMSEALALNPSVRVPNVYGSHSGSGVLTMEFVPTLAISEVVAQDPDDEEGKRSSLMTRLAETFVAQTFFYRFLHGDFHGKNVGIDEEDRFVLYDLGQVVDLKGRLSAPLKFLIGAFFGASRLVSDGLIGMSDGVDGNKKAPKGDAERRLRKDVETLLKMAHEDSRRFEYAKEAQDLAAGALDWSASNWFLEAVVGKDRTSAAYALFGAAKEQVEADLGQAKLDRIDAADVIARMRESLTTFFADPERAKLLSSASGELAGLGPEKLVDRIIEQVSPKLLERARQYGYAQPADAGDEARTVGRWIKDALLWLPRKLKPSPGLLHRLQLNLRIRGRGLAIAAAATSARAMGRHELGLSADYFQLLKTSCSFWSNWWRLRGEGDQAKRPNFLLLMRELFLLEPLRYEAEKLQIPKLVRAVEHVRERFQRNTEPPLRDEDRRLYTFART